jgi:uncharacterized membrane protein YvlD (DUF360 family)
LAGSWAKRITFGHKIDAVQILARRRTRSCLACDVEGFGPAFLGALLVIIVSFVLSLFVKSSEDGKTS